MNDNFFKKMYENTFVRAKQFQTIITQIFVYMYQ